MVKSHGPLTKDTLGIRKEEMNNSRRKQATKDLEVPFRGEEIFRNNNKKVK